MFQDIGVSKDLNEQFKRHLTNSNEPLDRKFIKCILFKLKLNVFSFSVDFSIQVLSSGSWPFQQSFTFALPQEVFFKI
jgi:cullin 1